MTVDPQSLTLPTASVFPELPGPQLTVLVKDAELGLLGYLVIDRVLAGKCSGGIRMAPDVSLEEVTSLARAMTLKFAFKGSLIGGAKAGILCPEDADAEQRRKRLEAFGRQLAPLMPRPYQPGGDIGVGPEELSVIKRAAGLSVRPRPATGMAGDLTAYGVFASASAALQHMGREVRGSSFLIEGYGRVGRALAGFLHKAGGIVAGVSTVRGAVYDPGGLNLDRLESLSGEHGDDAVCEYSDSPPLEPRAMLSLPADVLIPGARVGSIDREAAERLQVRLVVSAANVPFTTDAVQAASKKGILVVPDFVSNSGGIIGASYFNYGFALRRVLVHLQRYFSGKVSLLLKLAEESGRAVEDVAVALAMANLERMREEAGRKRRRSTWVMARITEEKNILPMMERAAMRAYLACNLRYPLIRRFLEPLALGSMERGLVNELEFMRKAFPPGAGTR